MPVRRGSFSFRVICGSLVVRIDAASRPITIHRTTITPLGYIPAHHILVSLSPSLRLSLSLARSHACTFSCAPSSLPPSHHLSFSLSLPTFFISTCLITNNQAYLPVSLEKNCPGFELLRITPLSFAHDSCSYSLHLLRPRFKLSYEVRIIIYWSFVSDIQVAVSLAILNVRLTKCATHCFSSSFFSFFFFFL